MTTIFTDISNLDLLLEHGVFEGDIIEICGKPDTGKTILATTIAVNLSQNQEFETVYLDINNGFEGTRVYRILRDRGCLDQDIEKIMQRIIVEKVQSLEDLVDILEDLFDFLRKSPKAKLLILDSMSSIWFANMFSYKSTLKKITQIVGLLRKLATHFKLIVITVNIFIDNYIQEAKDCSKGDAVLQATGKIKPAMGKYWLTVPNTRLGLEKNGSELKISILKSNIYPSDEFCFLQFFKSFIQ